MVNFYVLEATVIIEISLWDKIKIGLNELDRNNIVNIGPG
jgi:hypothetical protein